LSYSSKRLEVGRPESEVLLASVFRLQTKSNAEIYHVRSITVLKNAKVWMVLDVDSDKLNNFDETDAHYLHEIIKLIETKYDSLYPSPFLPRKTG
jgi:hypothetical protein